jgi:predicted nucleic acid-binding protein
LKRTLLICDAGPIILLAKMDRIEKLVLTRHFETRVLTCVAEEVLRGPFEPLEEERLRQFLKVVPPRAHEIIPPSDGGLRASDLACLDYTKTHPGSWLLADDRLLRRAARTAGCPVIGFPGLLLDAVSQNRLPATEAISLLDQAIADHAYRISIRLYQSLRMKLNEVPSP